LIRYGLVWIYNLAELAFRKSRKLTNKLNPCLIAREEIKRRTCSCLHAKFINLSRDEQTKFLFGGGNENGKR
jgi:hypothetical protein